MTNTADWSVQSEPEREVRNALAAYKMCLINAHYRNWVHRVSCWVGDKESLRWESALSKAEAEARVVVNRSADHKNFVRLISSQQPVWAREKDKFLTLLN